MSICNSHDSSQIGGLMLEIRTIYILNSCVLWSRFSVNMVFSEGILLFHSLVPFHYKVAVVNILINHESLQPGES